MNLKEQQTVLIFDYTQFACISFKMCFSFVQYALICPAGLSNCQMSKCFSPQNMQGISSCTVSSSIYNHLVSNWTLTSCHPHRVTSEQSNSVILISKWTFQNSSHRYINSFSSHTVVAAYGLGFLKCTN